MGEPVNRIEVDILGETYILKGDEAPGGNTKNKAV
ncbi:MAG: hypothetical protein XD78_1577 [Desulfotomaculum sp. 46_296]|nr:MAG: hypothetical protein XD78_1577 [Desulfotomaculum sp. 46_296]